MVYDFSLLRLKSAVDFGSMENVFPACWPTQPKTVGSWVKLCICNHWHNPTASILIYFAGNNLWMGYNKVRWFSTWYSSRGAFYYYGISTIVPKLISTRPTWPSSPTRTATHRATAATATKARSPTAWSARAFPTSGAWTPARATPGDRLSPSSAGIE